VLFTHDEEMARRRAARWGRIDNTAAPGAPVSRKGNLRLEVDPFLSRSERRDHN